MISTTFPIYGLMILLSLIINIIIVFITSKKHNLTNNETIGLIFYENAGIIVGAKLLSFITNYNSFNGEFNILKTGISSYGGVIGLILMLILFSFQFKKSFKELLCIHMPSLPLMYAIGKIGCFLVGCCHGIEYDGPFSVIYKYSNEAPNYISLFPVQICESLVFGGIAIYLFYKVLNKKLTIKTVGTGFILCGFGKFVLDFLRMSHVGKILSLNQIISLFFIVIGLFIVLKYRKIV